MLGECYKQWVDNNTGKNQRQTTGYMREISTKFQNWWSGRSLILTLVVPFLTLVVMLNLVRSFTDAQRNYQVYIAEQELLSNMRSENDFLQNQLAYYKSYEYKRLYARDNLRLAEPGERLYKIEGPAQVYQPRQKEYSPTKAQPNIYWWGALLGVTRWGVNVVWFTAAELIIRSFSFGRCNFGKT